MDPGDISVTRTPTTKSRQRMCQIVAETVSTGETIDVTLSAVFDQQEVSSADINEVYAMLERVPRSTSCRRGAGTPR